MLFSFFVFFRPFVFPKYRGPKRPVFQAVFHAYSRAPDQKVFQENLENYQACRLAYAKEVAELAKGIDY